MSFSISDEFNRYRSNLKEGIKSQQIEKSKPKSTVIESKKPLNKRIDKTSAFLKKRLRPIGSLPSGYSKRIVVKVKGYKGLF